MALKKQMLNTKHILCNGLHLVQEEHFVHFKSDTSQKKKLGQVKCLLKTNRNLFSVQNTGTYLELNNTVLIEKTDRAPVCLLNTPGISHHLLFMSHSVYLLIQDGSL